MNDSNTAARPQDNDEIEIDLGEIFGLILHWIWLILLVAFICGAIGFAFSKYVLPEQFKSTTRVYILNQNDSSNAMSQSEMQAGAQLTKDYGQLITSRTVLEQVIKDLSLTDSYTYEQFKEKVAVSTPTDTRLIDITVTDTDPKTAQNIANDVRIVASEHIQNVMQIDAVNVVDEANLPTKKAAPSNSRYALIAAMLGALLVSAIVIIRFLMDDTIKTSDDVEKYLGLSTLALIPLDENVGTGGTGRKVKSRRTRSRRQAAEQEYRSERRERSAKEKEERREAKRSSNTGRIPSIPQEITESEVSVQQDLQESGPYTTDNEVVHSGNTAPIHTGNTGVIHTGNTAPIHTGNTAPIHTGNAGRLNHTAPITVDEEIQKAMEPEQAGGELSSEKTMELYDVEDLEKYLSES